MAGWPREVDTAITEDRPYRRGMGEAEALGVLDKLVASGGQDGQVVGTLRADFDAINAIRRKEQSAYGVKQGLLARVMGATKTAVASA